MLAIVACLALQSMNQTVVLQRGAALEGSRCGIKSYWAVQDTSIGADAPDADRGGEYLLEGNRAKNILIRFGDLDRVFPAGTRVVSASLVLTIQGGDASKITAVAKLLRPWQEGPWLTPSKLAQAGNAPKNGQPVKPPRGAATWLDAMAGVAKWSRPGANGSSDSEPLQGWTTSISGNSFVISGLNAVVQSWINAWQSNNGLMLRFSSLAQFASCKDPTNGPKLVLTVQLPKKEPTHALAVTLISSDPVAPIAGQDVQWTATIANEGPASVRNIAVNWLRNGRSVGSQEITQPIAPGASVSESLTLKFVAALGQMRHPILEVTATPSGQSTPSGVAALAVSETAIPIAISLSGDAGAKAEEWAQERVRWFDSEVLRESRFSFAPDGTPYRVRIESFSPVVQLTDAGANGATLKFFKLLAQNAGLLSGKSFQQSISVQNGDSSVNRATFDLYPGLLGYGDTRFERTLPAQIQLNNEPVADPLIDSLRLQPTDLLAATDVGKLNQFVLGEHGPPWPSPKLVIIHALDFSQSPIADSQLDVFSCSSNHLGATPIVSLKTSSTGIAVLSASKLSLDGDANPVYCIRATRFGISAFAWLKAWQLSQAFYRGNRAVVFFNLHFDVPAQAIDYSENLALGKEVADSAGDDPASLDALLAPKNSVSVSLPATKGSWVQIDMIRDRTVGEIRLWAGASMWKKFKIEVFGTGQDASDAISWADETDWPLTLAERSDGQGGSVAYRSTPIQIRFIRIVNESGAPGSMFRVAAYATK